MDACTVVGASHTTTQDTHARCKPTHKAARIEANTRDRCVIRRGRAGGGRGAYAARPPMRRLRLQGEARLRPAIAVLAPPGPRRDDAQTALRHPPCALP